jgi:hypothetical protein
LIKFRTDIILPVVLLPVNSSTAITRVANNKYKQLYWL